MSDLNVEKCKELIYSGFKRIYLCGPMSGIKQFNFPLFDSVARELRDVGFDVVSPAELDDPKTRKICLASPDGVHNANAQGSTWEECLARDIKLIAEEDLDGIICLPGWTKSRGGNFEVAIARSLSKPTYKYPKLGPVTHEPRLPFQESDE